MPRVSVIDDASTDDTGSVAQNANVPVRVIHPER